MFLERNTGHLKTFSFLGSGEKIRVQILNMLKGTKYVTFYLYSCWFVLYKLYEKSLGAKEGLINFADSDCWTSSCLFEHLH